MWHRISRWMKPPIALALALALAACGSVGPIGAHKSHVELSPSSSYGDTNSGISGPVASPPATNWSDVNERNRANEAAAQTGHCPLHNPLCH